MSLRAKTLLVIGITLIGLLSILYLAADQILLAGFERLEAQDMRQNVGRAADALADDLKRLNTTAFDYAAWDDTYAFAAGENPAYVDSNLNEQTYTNLGLHVLVILNQVGEVVYSSGFDQATLQLVPVPAGLAAYLTPTSPLLQQSAETDSLTGFVMLGDDALLIAARPILSSDYTGPIHGTLIMGRYLDLTEIEHLAQITHLSLLVAPVDSATTPPDFEAAQAAISSATPIFVQPLGVDAVAGYTQLSDLDGRPALLLRVDAPRVIYAEGRNSVTFFLISLLLAGLVFGALIWLLLERLVLARLAHLSRSVQAIGAEGDSAARVAVAGHDELSNVATAINGMLQAQAEANAATRASEEKFRKLAETSAAAIFIAQGGRVRFANSQAEALTGYTHQELVRMPFETVIPLALPSPTLPPGRAVTISANRPDQYEIQVSNPRGPTRWLEVTAGPIEYDGEPATIATAYDITERKHAAQDLVAANERLTALVTQLGRRNRESSLLSQLSDVLQACPTAEESYANIARFLPPLLPAQASILYSYRASRDKLEAVAAIGRLPAAAREQFFAPDACWALRLGRTHNVTAPDSELPCAHVTEATPGGYLCVPIVARGEALGVLHVRFDAGEAGETERAEWVRLTETVGERLALAMANVDLREALRHQAVRDPLTGLFNRRYLQETLGRELSRAARSQHSVGVLFIDIDHFKLFNDTHGHDAGDALLREVGRLLRNSLRVEDIACRYGGEEFLLILPDIPLAVAQQRAETLRQAVEALRVKHSDQLLEGVTLSIGVAAYPDHGATGEELIRAADQALYQAKRAGRNRTRVAA